MYGSKKPERAIDKTHITRRKAIRKAARRYNSGEPTVWVGGVLYFTNFMGRVKGAPNVPKPGREAKGLASCLAPKPRSRQRSLDADPRPQRTRYIIQW